MVGEKGRNEFLARVALVRMMDVCGGRKSTPPGICSCPCWIVKYKTYRETVSLSSCTSLFNREGYICVFSVH
jgi:hypothetical protein